MANAKATKTSITPATRKKMKSRGKSERTKLLDAMKKFGKTEDDFYALLMEKAFNPEDNFTFKELLNRMSPIAKATSPLITFDFNPNGKPHHQAKQALAAAANGEIPTDLANMFITSISAMLNIQEKTDFEIRLKAIEDASKQD